MAAKAVDEDGGELQKHPDVTRDFLKLEGCLYLFDALLFGPVVGGVRPVALLAPRSDA